MSHGWIERVTVDVRCADTGEYDGGGAAHGAEEGGVDGTKLCDGGHCGGCSGSAGGSAGGGEYYLTDDLYDLCALHSGRADDTRGRRCGVCSVWRGEALCKQSALTVAPSRRPCPSSDTETPPPPPPPPRPPSSPTSPLRSRTRAPSRPRATYTTHTTSPRTISSDTTTSSTAGYAPRPSASGTSIQSIYQRALPRRKGARSGESV